MFEAINKIKRKDVERVYNYVKNNNLYDKMVVYGGAIDENCTEDTELNIALNMIDDKNAEDNTIMNTMYQDICAMVDSPVSVFVINDPDFADSYEFHDAISKGVVIYERQSKA